MKHIVRLTSKGDFNSLEESLNPKSNSSFSFTAKEKNYSVEVIYNQEYSYIIKSGKEVYSGKTSTKSELSEILSLKLLELGFKEKTELNLLSKTEPNFDLDSFSKKYNELNRKINSEEFLYENRSLVSIDDSKIISFVKNTSLEKILSENTNDYFISLLQEKSGGATFDECVNFFFLINSINFAYWGTANIEKWTFSGTGKGGYNGVFHCLIDAIWKRKINLLDGTVLTNLSEVDFDRVFSGSGQLLMKSERLNGLRELGQALLKNNNKMSNFLLSNGYEANTILSGILTQLPLFSDSQDISGQKVDFLKRAQLLISDLHDVLVKFGKGISNVNILTVMVDYKLPLTLQHKGILVYHPDLIEKINKLELIEKNSLEEKLLRACTLEACERIVSYFPKYQNGQIITQRQLDAYLWGVSQDIDFKNEYHRTQTMSY